MQVETERYLTKIRDSVEEIRNKQALPKWQIDFEKYGGRAAYETLKQFYWKRYDMGFKNNDGLSPDVHKLMEQFKNDLNKQLDIPKKYDIYK